MPKVLTYLSIKIHHMCRMESGPVHAVAAWAMVKQPGKAGLHPGAYHAWGSALEERSDSDELLTSTFCILSPKP